MRPLLTLILLLPLLGCVSPPDPRPEVISQGDYTLQQGLRAFNGGDYVTAAAQFRNALLLYLGIDDLDGVARSRINLAETAFAVENLPVARRQVNALEEQLVEPQLAGYRDRVILLTAALAYREGERQRAVALLEPLMVEEEGRSPAIVVAAAVSRTRIALDGGNDAAQWLERLEAVTGRHATASTIARLAQLQGELALQQQRWTDAVEPLQRALIGFKGLQQRRGIAATLHLQGRLAIAERRWSDADRLLYRSLGVYSQLLDRRATSQLLGELAESARAQQKSERTAILEQWRQRLDDESFSDWPSLNRLQ